MSWLVGCLWLYAGGCGWRVGGGPGQICFPYSYKSSTRSEKDDKVYGDSGIDYDTEQMLIFSDSDRGKRLTIKYIIITYDTL